MLNLGTNMDSINISGHKWHGADVSGVVCIANGSNMSSRGDDVSYLDLKEDKMLTGSRSGVPPIIWLARLKQFNWKNEYERCIQNSHHLYNSLLQIGIPAG